MFFGRFIYLAKFLLVWRLCETESFRQRLALHFRHCKINQTLGHCVAALALKFGSYLVFLVGVSRLCGHRDRYSLKPNSYFGVTQTRSA